MYKYLGFRRENRLRCPPLISRTRYIRELKLEACFSNKVKVISGCQKPSGYYVFIEKFSIHIFKIYTIHKLQISGKSIHVNKPRHFCVYDCIVSLKKSLSKQRKGPTSITDNVNTLSWKVLLTCKVKYARVRKHQS